MPGIVKSTSKKIVANKKIREIVTPTATLDTDLYYSDLTAVGAAYTPAVLTSEYSRLPTIVKNEAELSLVASSRSTGSLFPMNGNTKTLDIMTFTRGSSAIVEAGGLLSSNSADIARVETNSGGSIKGYLFEPASTNLLKDSGVLNGITSFDTRGTTGLTAVDTGWNVGTLLAKGLRLDIDISPVYAYKNYTFVAGLSYVFSFFVKLSDGAALTNSDFAVNYQGQTTNISNTVVESRGNGLYRVYFPFVAKDVPQNYVGVYKRTTDSAKGVIVSGFQLEEGSVVTSYIPTTTASASRLADKLVSNRPVSVFPFNSWYIESDKITGWFGNYAMKGRNLIPNSNSSSYFAGYSGATLTKTDNVVVTEWGATDANRVVSSGGTHAIRVLQTITVPAVGEKVTVSGWFKNNGATAINVYSNQGARLDRLEAGQQKRVVWEAIEGNGNGSVQFQVNPVNINDNVDFIWWRLQHEKTLTVTPWTPDPADFVKIAGNGTVEVSSASAISIRSLSLVARQLKDSEY